MHPCNKRENSPDMTDLDYPPIIAFIGPKGAGKTTAADILVNLHGYSRLSLADPLRHMLKTFGISELHLSRKADKQVELTVLEGKTIRHALQTLGTEWGREHIGQDVWINHLLRRVAFHTRIGERVVIDDVRFPNEADRLKENGALLIKVVPHKQDDRDTHESEAYWRSLPFHAEVTNHFNGRFRDDIEQVLAEKTGCKVAASDPANREKKS